jgi:hypothetical protein
MSITSLSMILTDPHAMGLERSGNLESEESIIDMSSDGLVTLADVVLDVSHKDQNCHDR